MNNSNKGLNGVNLIVVLCHCSLITLMIMLTACNDLDGDEAMRTADESIIRIEINKQKFNIPVRYTYGYSKAKGEEFRTPKKERVYVDALTIEVLMPDLRPYFEADEEKWNIKGHGDRVSVDFKKRNGSSSWYEMLVESVNANIKSGNYAKISSVYGLDGFDQKAFIRYLPADKRQLTLMCDKQNKPNTSPSCIVKSEYRDDIVLEYSYGIKYLPVWKEIDDGLKEMFDGFANNAVK